MPKKTTTDATKILEEIAGHDPKRQQAFEKEVANSESCVTRSGHTTPVEQAPASREAAPGNPGN